MRASEFPIQRKNPRSTDVDLWNEQRPMPYKHVESPAPEIGGPGNYDSLVDHWQILFRHRKTLLAFVVAGLVAAILISLIQTPIYRVRTSLEIQGTSFLEPKGTNDPVGNYASPESYVETQVKLLQSESLVAGIHMAHSPHAPILRPFGSTGTREIDARDRAQFDCSHIWQLALAGSDV